MKHHRLIRDYVVVHPADVHELSSNGYEPVGGVSFNESVPRQAMALYEDVLIKEGDGNE